jgi:hypothetical protein
LTLFVLRAHFHLNIAEKKKKICKEKKIFFHAYGQWCFLSQNYLSK